ncbi:MAG TPA: hypothetical protein DIT64_16480 [Verrucomicrobiales bacterium]|nr:hypothetical protein [Verrucomicrobiales bacterium]
MQFSESIPRMARYNTGITYGSARYNEAENPNHKPSRIMSQNLVSAVLTQEDFDAVMAAFDLIESKLPFIKDLTPAERRGLVKMGPDSLSFVTGIQSLAAQNADSVPASVDLAEFNKDVALSQQMYQINQRAQAIAENSDDTTMAVGSDSMVSGLILYAVFQALGKAGALNVNVAELGRRFRKRRGAGSGGGETPPAQS